MTVEPRVWCAMIYAADSRDEAGAVRRGTASTGSKKTHAGRSSAG